MSQEESDLQSQEFQLILAQAKDALVEANYDEAESKYNAALEVGRRLYPMPCSETAACLVGLGDAYFGASKFDEAKFAYQESLDEFESMTSKFEFKDKITALFKFSKTLHVLKDYAQSDLCFAETVKLAEPNLPLGNPLLTGIYEAYANMLAQSHLDQSVEREEHWRDKAKECRGKFVPPKRPPQVSKPRELTKLRRAQMPREFFLDRIFGEGSAKGVLFLVVLILVSASAYAYSDKSIRTQLVHYLKAH
jgi:tetratricopeptide (TPR) repeat protein